MRTAIDSNVFSSIWSWEPSAEKMAEKLDEAKSDGALLISPFVFAELLAYPGTSLHYVQEFLDTTGVMVDYELDRRIWSESGLRYARYADRRRRSAHESPRRLLADFLIGAHALVQADRLLTLDPEAYQRDFPEIILM